MEIVGKILKIEDKISKNGTIYKLIHFLSNENKKINIYVFDEALFEDFNENSVDKNLIYKFNVEKKGKFLNLIEILDKYNPEETRNKIEEKVISGIIKFSNDLDLQNDIKKITFLKFFKNKTHKNMIKEYKEDGNIIIENYPEFNYIDIEKPVFIKYIKKLIELYNQEKEEELKRKILNGEKINIEELKKEEQNFSLEDFKAKNLLFNNSDFLFKYKGKKTLGCPTGIKELDKVIDGIFGLVGLTGVPGMGKTSLALQIADHNIFKIENEVIYISLEVSYDLLITKLAAFRAQTIMKHSLKDFLEYEEAVKFYEAIEEILDKENFYIIDKKFNPTFEMIENIVKKIKEKKPNKEILVVLDYLNIFNEPSLKDIKDKNEKMAHIIQNFIDIKNKTKANFLIILAKNKQGYKAAEMSSIKGDNNLEYGLETIVSLEDPKNVDINENPETLDFNVVAVVFKNRWGENFRKIPLKFEGRINRFFEVKIDN